MMALRFRALCARRGTDRRVRLSTFRATTRRPRFPHPRRHRRRTSSSSWPTTLGYGDVGVYGSQIPTPHIDQLARDGVRLTDGHVSAAVCSPMRAGFHTGRYQNRFGWEYNPTDHDLGVPLDQKTIANHFQDAGYVTGLIGKWHLGVAEPYHPLHRGFDEFYGLAGRRLQLHRLPASRHPRVARRGSPPPPAPASRASSATASKWSRSRSI